MNRQTPFAFKIAAYSTYFLSDLGGTDEYGQEGYKDLNLEHTRYGIGVGLQYRKGDFSLNANSTYLRLFASDGVSSSARGNRGLHVITDVLELSTTVEYCFPQNTPLLRNFYLNLGYGIMLYSPKAEYQGELYQLRPLGTEGQNYLPGVNPYRTFSPVIPFGFGYKLKFIDGSNLALDVSLRKSFTDYLDDVSTFYANSESIAQKSGPVAQALADPTGNFEEGDIRGSSKAMDNYFMIGFKYTLPLGKRYNVCSFDYF